MRPPDPDNLETELRKAIDAGDTVAIGVLGELLDAHDETKRHQSAQSLHAVALWYAEQGLRVFPLQPRSKIPYRGSNGCKDGTTDAGQVERWWTARPDSNIGIATGHLVDVIDIDGTTGVLSWARAMWGPNRPDGWPGDYIGPVVIGKVSTPRSGGNHYYIHADPEEGNRAGVLPGIDYRASGGYVVAPPSVTDVGIYGWYSPLTLPPVAEGVA